METIVEETNENCDAEGIYEDSNAGYDRLKFTGKGVEPAESVEKILPKWKCVNCPGELCMKCGGLGFYMAKDAREPSDILVSEKITKTITETRESTPILPRESNGRRARDLFSNASLEDQITWIKGRLSDVNNPILSIGQRQAARLQLGHCLEKDREHKLPLDLRLEAARVSMEPLPRLGRLKSN